MVSRCFHMFLNITSHYSKICNFLYFYIFFIFFRSHYLKNCNFLYFYRCFSYFFNITDPDLLPPKSFEDLKLTPHVYLGSLRFSGGLTARLVQSRWKWCGIPGPSHYHGSVKHASLQYVRSFLKKKWGSFSIPWLWEKGYLILLRKDHTYSWNICDIIHPVMDLVQVSSIFHLELDCCGSELT